MMLPFFEGGLMKYFKRYFSIFIAVITLLYAVGEYFSWWEELSGRKDIVEAYNKFLHNQGGLKITIFYDDPLYSSLQEFVLSYTQNDSIRILADSGIFPTMITRVGGTINTNIGDLPESWPSNYLATSISPIMCAYNYDHKNVQRSEGIGIDNSKYIGTLGEFREWIYESSVMSSI